MFKIINIVMLPIIISINFKLNNPKYNKHT